VDVRCYDLDVEEGGRIEGRGKRRKIGEMEGGEVEVRRVEGKRQKHTSHHYNKPTNVAFPSLPFPCLFLTSSPSLPSQLSSVVQKSS